MYLLYANCNGCLSCTAIQTGNSLSHLAHRDTMNKTENAQHKKTEFQLPISDVSKKGINVQYDLIP